MFPYLLQQFKIYEVIDSALVRVLAVASQRVPHTGRSQLVGIPEIFRRHQIHLTIFAALLLDQQRNWVLEIV